MKVLLTGAGGQLGQALIASAPEGLELVAISRQELDLADPDACRSAVEEHQPDWVLNAGAYTAVDKAEAEPELAHAVNAGAPEAFARALDQQGGRLLQISTDFVFNGTQGSPYRPDQQRDPLGVYGASKAAGEAALQSILGTDGRGLILHAICAQLDQSCPGSAPHADLITPVTDRPGHDRRYAIDPGRISSELGWSPRHDVEHGLAETVCWYLKHQEWCSNVRERAGYDGSRLGIGAALNKIDLP